MSLLPPDAIPLSAPFAFETSAPSEVIDHRLSKTLERVALGDRVAFRELFDLTKARLYPICLRLVRDPAVAQDVLQETYVRVWHSVSSYRGQSDGEAKSWLFHIARSRSLDFLRSQRRMVDTLDGDAVQWEDIADESSDGDQYVAHCAPSPLQMKDCLSKLTEKKQRAIALAFYEGYSYPEIAHQLDESLPAVKSDVRRGLLELRRCLQQIRSLQLQ